MRHEIKRALDIPTSTQQKVAKNNTSCLRTFKTSTDTSDRKQKKDNDQTKLETYITNKLQLIPNYLYQKHIQALVVRSTPSIPIFLIFRKLII